MSDNSGQQGNHRSSTTSRQRRSSNLTDGTRGSGELSQNSRTKTSNAANEDLYKDGRSVICLRSLVTLILVTAAALVGAFAYVTLRDSEREAFEQQYYGSVAKISEGFQNAIDTKIWPASTFSAMYTSRYGPMKDWPNATMPDFQEQAYGQLRLSNGRALSFNPIITNETRDAWEAHASENVEILGAESLIYRASNTSRIVDDGIFMIGGQDDIGYYPESRYPTTMVPVWQIAPIETNEKAVMFNLHSETNRQRALDDMLYYKVPALTAILQLVQDVDLRPSAILFYPVFDSFSKEAVVGSISIVFSWDDALGKLLPSYINGIVCVLETNIGQQYSFQIDGEVVTILGEGDLHDDNFDHMKITVDGNVEGTQEDLGVVDNLITYKLNIYPSSTLEAQYVTSAPRNYTIFAVLIFVVTSAIFLLYDIAVKNKQSRIVQAATRSATIIDSFFPAAFRDRVFKTPEAPQKNRKTSLEQIKKSIKKTSALMNPSQKMLNFLSPGQEGTVGDHTDLTVIDKEPIADYFQSATVMFADIAGFTTWSSERDPSEVFILLEALFKDFDTRAERLGIFKISTIGDCYLACCGLPDARDDHAEVMAQFSRECQASFDAIVEDLDFEGYADAATLRLRSGLHSGPVTAGVLRGVRSRFEVFGDTVNTASRMESTGEPKKIQLSQQTAQLLIDAGKQSWIKPRDQKVFAKGKGDLQTYWLLMDDTTSPNTSIVEINDDAHETFNINVQHPVAQNNNIIEGMIITEDKYTTSQEDNDVESARSD